MSAPSDRPIRLTLENLTSRKMQFSLEPVGYFYELAPHESIEAVFQPSHAAPHLEISLDDRGLSVWDTSGTGDALAPLGGHHGDDEAAGAAKA